MKKTAIVAALLGAIVAMPSQAAVTVGNPANPAAVVDSCTNCTFVINQGFGVAGLQVSSYSFFANTTNNITPLLFTRVDNGTLATFTVVAIGQQRTATLGVNTYGFNVAQGANLTATNTYFGFTYNNGGVVALNYSTPSPTSGAFVGPNNFAVALGATFTDDFSTQPENSYDALNARTYSINATAVPEPATWAMMLLGFGMVGFGLRARRTAKVATRVTYA